MTDLKKDKSTNRLRTSYSTFKTRMFLFVNGLTRLIIYFVVPFTQLSVLFPALRVLQQRERDGERLRERERERFIEREGEKEE
jgi:hypothetical protein